MTTEPTMESAAHSGIPKTDFLEAVDEYMKKPENESAEAVLKRFDELHNKYKFMDYNLTTKKSRLKNQIPDLRTSLDILRHMKSKKDSADPMESRFLLSDHLFAKAKIPPTEKVSLWLGANVMLEYTTDDAENLLEKNLSSAVSSLSQVEENIGFLRDQMTTLEVNMARVYNWDVKRRQAGVAVKS